MTMTNEEIVRHYRQAADKSAEIRVLADLNVTDRNEIIAILEDAGEVLPGKHRAGKLDGKIKPLYEQGLNDAEIAERLGCSATAVAKWRKRNGLPVNHGPARKEAEAGGLPPESIYTRIETIIASLPEDASECARKTARELVVALFRDDIERRLELGGRGGQSGDGE